MKTSSKKSHYQYRLEDHCNIPEQAFITDTSKKGRLSQVLMKMLFIGDNIRRNKGIAQMIIYPFRCWAPQTVKH